MTTKRLIVFFIPPQKVINGGILSIFSICATSREFYPVHKSGVAISVYPGYGSYKKNDLFENQETIYSFEEVLSPNIEFLQLHIPEYASEEVFKVLLPYKDQLSQITELRINILNQNVLLLPKPIDLAKWFTFTPFITQTTAHDKYSTQELANDYCMPCHHLSTYVDPNQFHFRGYDDKENIILMSPDVNPARSKIVDKLMTSLKNYKFITVQDMKYGVYKDLISKARFSLTFGEGFDGYFIEAFLSGGIGFAVYNDEFFPSRVFSTYENTFSSYEEMSEEMLNRIRKLEDKKLYTSLVSKNFKEISKLYSFSSYKENLKNFYLHKYTFIPQVLSAGKLIACILEDKNHQIIDLQLNKQELEKQLKAQMEATENNIKALNEVLSSSSWKYTSPLRKVNKNLKRRGSS